jgi:hypothetical protein
MFGIVEGMFFSHYAKIISKIRKGFRGLLEML